MELQPLERAAAQGDTAAVRAALGEDAFAAAREAGRALPPEEAVAEALAVADEVAAEPNGPLA